MASIGLRVSAGGARKSNSLTPMPTRAEVVTSSGEGLLVCESEPELVLLVTCSIVDAGKSRF